jgi:hypothetical protein
MQRQRIGYVIADSSHARIVMWDSAVRGYHTRLTLQDGAAPRAARVRRASRGTVYESASPQRRGLGDRAAVRERIRQAFAEVLVQQIHAFVAETPVEGLVLAAPVRFLTPLKEGLADAPPVVVSVAKNLVKTPDHELADWLTPLELNARRH